MNTTYHRYANVEFRMDDTTVTVKVSNLPYCVIDGDFDKGEMSAVFDAIRYLRTNGVEAELTLVCITTSPNTPNLA